LAIGRGLDGAGRFYFILNFLDGGVFEVYGSGPKQMGQVPLFEPGGCGPPKKKKYKKIQKN
jgi:hypothetical protein